MNFLKNANFRRNLLIALIILLASSAAFGLGRMSVLMGEKEPIVIEEPPPLRYPAVAIPVATTTPSVAKELAPPPPAEAPTEATYVASRTGKSYYFPWCGIVKRIKKENLVSFKSKTEAEQAGYSPGNCAGLK